jgi:predicted enzyme related to lactoylglutathione lyase
MVGRHGHFAWYELLTTDMTAAKAFYGTVLGWAVRDASTAKFAYSIFTAGDTPVCGLMELPPEGRKMGATPRWVGYVAVDDVDSTVDRLKRHGGTVYVPPIDTNIGRISIIADPQKATLAVAEGLKLDQSAEFGRPGRVSWHELLASDWKTAFPFYSALFGWERAEARTGSAVGYQMLSAGGHVIGGMFTKLPVAPFPFWLYYFNVPEIAVAAKQVTAGGGRIAQGPLEVQGGGWIIRCIDPQGAMFALQADANQGGVKAVSDAELGWSAAWGELRSHGRLVAEPVSKQAPKPAAKSKPASRTAPKG